MDLTKLIPHATGDDGRISLREQYAMVTLKRKLDGLATVPGGERSVAISPNLWRIVKDIALKTNFGRPGEPPPIDLDGLDENEYPDGQPPQGNDTEIDHVRDWAVVGVDLDDDC